MSSPHITVQPKSPIATLRGDKGYPEFSVEVTNPPIGKQDITWKWDLYRTEFGQPPENRILVASGTIGYDPLKPPTVLPQKLAAHIQTSAYYSIQFALWQEKLILAKDESILTVVPEQDDSPNSFIVCGANGAYYYVALAPVQSSPVIIPLPEVPPEGFRQYMQMNPPDQYIVYNIPQEPSKSFITCVLLSLETQGLDQRFALAPPSREGLAESGGGR